MDPLNNNVKADGIKQDADNAMKAYKKAAAKGHVEAQFCIANWYYSIKKDYEHAAKWYKLAAYGGYGEAQNMLGYMYGRKMLKDVSSIPEENKDFQKNFNKG